MERSGIEMTDSETATETTILNPLQDSAVTRTRTVAPTKIFQWNTLAKSIILLFIFSLIVPVAAVDTALVPLEHSQDYDTYDTRPNAMMGRLPVPIFETLEGCVFLLIGSLNMAMQSVLGPVMGISSVLWFIMRNDAAVKPAFSWMVFVIWSVTILLYLAHQCNRVAHHRLYVLFALAFSGVCLCVVALVQKSSIQGGIVTAIPPCSSFAAYAVAFVFPDRRRSSRERILEIA